MVKNLVQVSEVRALYGTWKSVYTCWLKGANQGVRNANVAIIDNTYTAAMPLWKFDVEYYNNSIAELLKLTAITQMELLQTRGDLKIGIVVLTSGTSWCFKTFTNQMKDENQLGTEKIETSACVARENHDPDFQIAARLQ